MKKRVTILFTSVGRRVELVQEFKRAAGMLGIEAWLIGADMTENAPAVYFCDEYVKVCRIKEPDYIPGLLSICKEKKVDVLIPTIDTDLLLLSQNKEKFDAVGTVALISAQDKIAACRDKRYTYDFFKSCGLQAPKPYDDVEAYMDQYKETERGGYPCFIKPLDGSSSIDAYKVLQEKDLCVYAKKIGDYIIQPFVDGTEYTIDIFCDFDGNPVYITPRERCAVRSGEVLKTRIVHDDTMLKEAQQIIRQFQPCGPITVQLIQDKDGINHYIEINPRYGGGAPLSMKAGANSAKALLQLACGEVVEERKDAARINMQYSRFDQSVCVSPEELVKITDLEEILEMKELDAVVFDLDDTLYLERDYVRSGFRKVAELLPEVPDAYEGLMRYFEEGKMAIDELLKEKQLYTEERKAQCIKCYQYHKPELQLEEKVTQVLGELTRRGIRLGMITDGRVEGQRAKIESLGLGDVIEKIIITDELGGVQFRKPNDISFRIMQNYFKTEPYRMLYVGDNIRKDFIAPLQLGMRCAWLKQPEGLYQH